MSFLYPELSKMFVSASTSGDHKSTIPILETRTLIETDGITKYTGADNN
jgi:hypothetical protein